MSLSFTFRNVNEAFSKLVEGIERGRIWKDCDCEDCKHATIQTTRRPSRVGEVLQIPVPVCITYTHPRERVLFNTARDCNPFFHVYEALWMLAGLNDIEGPAYYAANYRDCVQDGDSPIANGAYGYRWRKADSGRYETSSYRSGDGYGSRTITTRELVREDQLHIIAERLRKNPDDRRCVLQMWNVEDDLLKADTSKDICCNTHAYFLIRYKYNPQALNGAETFIPHLDMTVCNRSNDLVWGALGANVVHFSFLQEYLAAKIGCEVGVYNQFTNNLHCYTERWYPEKWLDSGDHTDGISHLPPSWAYQEYFKLVEDPERFDREVLDFVERHKQDALAGDYQEPFLRNVAEPMCIAFHYHKKRDYVAALHVADNIAADDWRISSKFWLNKRHALYQKRSK